MYPSSLVLHNSDTWELTQIHLCICNRRHQLLPFLRQQRRIVIVVGMGYAEEDVDMEEGSSILQGWWIVGLHLVLAWEVVVVFGIDFGVVAVAVAVVIFVLVLIAAVLTIAFAIESGEGIVVCVPVFVFGVGLALEVGIEVVIRVRFEVEGAGIPELPLSCMVEVVRLAVQVCCFVYSVHRIEGCMERECIELCLAREDCFSKRGCWIPGHAGIFPCPSQIKASPS